MSSKHRLILIALATFGFFAAFTLLIFTRRNKHNPIVKSASALFVSILALGAIPAYASLFLYMDSASSFKCLARPWLQLTSFSIVVGCLIVKNIRVYFVYCKLPKRKLYLLKDRTMAAVLSALICLEVMLLGGYSSVSNVEVNLSLSYRKEFQYRCINSRSGNQMNQILWGFNGVLLNTILFVAYLSRKVGYAHSELSQLIVIYFCTAISIMLIFILRADDAIRQTESAFNEGVLIWFSTTVPILTQFVPKAIQLYNQEILFVRYLCQVLSQELR
ncbi:hypothetical protein BCR33DRAFT_418413 [Rhizoclosmatium globosum]|uniref:G-protein coupled receptors family 3 profile domain-containing protein n=1 Tax=Rhizoclosmatium globosum TaxID=329046 RepID=A0A1Y2BYI5_9FUNG|nr:hypothetical protein BCR33DRAFT_418413 [Rhizoclosmatium globosum]|eukprot:ORY39125.1 hypothetical protein BCR33DRAFT_418413 [Rhizoclosmatium globosum]